MNIPLLFRVFIGPNLPLDKSRILHYNIDINCFALNFYKIVSGEVQSFCS